MEGKKASKRIDKEVGNRIRQRAGREGKGK